MSEDKGTAALFDDMPAVSEGDKAAPARRAVPRLQHAVREQVELRACDLESLIAPEHRVRSANRNFKRPFSPTVNLWP